MVRFVRIRAVFFTVPFILLFFFLAVDSLVDDSPTMDEQNHIARGIAFIKSGDPRLSLEHPPLINTLSALPLLTEPSIAVPFDDPSWDAPGGWYAFANEFMWNRGNNPERVTFLARMPILFIMLGMAVVGYHFAREMWGKLSAMFAFVFLLFDPNLLAHGRYATTDIGGAAMLLLAVFLLWRLWRPRGWDWRRLATAGFGLGLALGSKLSTALFLPILALMSLLPLYEYPWRFKEALRRLLQLAVASFIGFLVLWLIYGFEFGPAHFSSGWLRFLDDVSLPIPTYWSGIGQILDISGGGRASYLLGEFSSSGWWTYFPVTFVVKTPIILLVLIGLSSIILVWNRKSRGRAFFLLIPSAIYFLVSMQSSLNIGYRHLLPILPFLLILASGLASPKIKAPKFLASRPAFGPALLLAAACIVLVIDLFMHPSYLSYFNLFAGGPENGHKVIVDSNIDWGQDMKRLKEWIDENDIDEVKLSWFGTANPDYYGIQYEPLPGLPYYYNLWWDVPFDTQSPEPGIYVISVSNLWEIPLENKTVFAWFRDRTPDEKIGYSIFIYLVDIDA